MSKMTMAEIKALAKKKSNDSGGSNNNFKNSDIYPFWQMQEDDEAIVRFLPAKNESEHPLPFIEKWEHKLAIEGNTRKVPCPKNHGNSCPICDLSQEFYKAEGKDSKNGKYYWRDRMHLCKALVISDPLPADSETGETYKGKLVTLQLGFQIHEKIMAQIGDFFEDDDPLPWDLEDGFNFKIKVTKQGKHKKYDLASSFERKSSEIPTEYLENVKLVDLETLLPEEVTYDKANEFLEMHKSGGVSGGDGDDDSLDNKRNSSESDSKRAALLARMRGDGDEEDGEELDEDMKDVVESAREEEEDSSTTEETSSTNSDEDDDDDEDDQLKAIIQRRRGKSK